MSPIITRFPPSPTGFLHLGGARTALFNWLYARHTGGRFVLRIEDTDRQRSNQESVDAIFQGLEWLGIDWDEGPYFQSERFGIYKEYVSKLMASGNAYACTCSPEAIEAMRERARARGENPKYDGTCRERGLPLTDGAVVRFKSPQTGTTVLDDRAKGAIVFQNADMDDFVIARSDGVPTYNFVVVVDDMLMGINTIIRGDDHVMNTPKQIQIYKALGHPLPTFAHVPMVLGPDRTKLSKRHGAMSVIEYREMGFLPEAMINYLVRLGWSFGDQEFFTRQELIEKFSLENIGKAAGIFDIEKLTALNADHIQHATPETLWPQLAPFLARKGLEAAAGPWIYQVIETLMPRSKTLVEMAEAAAFYFGSDVSYDEAAAKKFLKPGILEPLRLLTEKLSTLSAFDEPSLEAAFGEVMATCDIKLGKIAQPVRVALTGRTASPGIFEILAIIGKDIVIHRLNTAVAFVTEREAKSA
ncbi:MAG: glutamate--tRNA ligase [Pseudomonadota bacterium]